MRIGQGWDIHKLEKGHRLILGGVEIPSQAGTVAHSDGDALVHAVIDAMLGAAAEGDIGKVFPDNDPEWKDADSLILLKKTLEIITKKGLKPVNIDTSIILQAPKLRPHIDKMRERIAITLKLDVSNVSVKAKTNEGMGEIGAGRAVEAQAIVLLEHYES